jgi:hypothetical protein
MSAWPWGEHEGLAGRGANPSYRRRPEIRLTNSGLSSNLRLWPLYYGRKAIKPAGGGRTPAFMTAEI